MTDLRQGRDEKRFPWPLSIITKSFEHHKVIFKAMPEIIINSAPFIGLWILSAFRAKGQALKTVAQTIQQFCLSSWRLIVFHWYDSKSC